jgi:hypothetical protein
MDHPKTFPRLMLTLPPHALIGFASLLQHGILLPVEHSVAVLPFLLSLPGFTADYIEQTVQTIFINGVAADSLDRELGAGATLALSAAMPGLAGAIFRRQGVHGSLRSRPAETTPVTAAESGVITLKLFNSIATDRVQDLLSRGVLVSGKAMHDFAAMREGLFQPPTVAVLEGKPVGLAELLQATGECPTMFVQATP